LADEDRLLAAGVLLKRVNAGIAAADPSDRTAITATAELGAWSVQLAARYEIMRKRLAALASEDVATSTWKKVFDKEGSRTFVKRESGELGNTLVLVKCESELTGVRLEHFLATARETDLYHTWFPNTRRSETLLAPGRMERAFRTIQCVKLPVVADVRYDVLLHCFAIDAMEEKGFFMVCGSSPKPEDLPEVTFPPPENGKRLQLDTLVVIIEPDLAPGAQRIKATLQIAFDESRLFLPRFAVDFIAANVVSRIFSKQSARARDISAGRAAEHVSAMAADTNFYDRWLPARLDELRSKGTTTRWNNESMAQQQ